MNSSTKCIYLLGLCAAIAATANSEINKNTIDMLIKEAFFADKTKPKGDDLFAADKLIEKSNNIIFQYIHSKNKTLGIKNDTIEKASIEMRNNIILLTNIIKITYAIAYEKGWTQENTQKIISNLDTIYDRILKNGIFIENTLKKRFPPLLPTSKELLLILKNLTDSTLLFIQKLKNAI